MKDAVWEEGKEGALEVIRKFFGAGLEEDGGPCTSPEDPKVGVGGTRISGILVRALEIFCPHTLIAESIKK